MITACVPSVAVAEALAGIERAAEVGVLVWEERDHPPEGLDRVEFLVPPYMAGPLPAEALAGMPRLRVIQLLSAGYDQWQSLVPVGVTLCNGRGIHGGSTAELAVGGLIAVLREIPRFHDQQRAGRWDPHRAGGLDGKRVLVLGAGDIGAPSAGAAVLLLLGGAAQAQAPQAPSQPPGKAQKGPRQAPGFQMTMQPQAVELLKATSAKLAAASPLSNTVTTTSGALAAASAPREASADIRRDTPMDTPVAGTAWPVKRATRSS